MSRNQPAPPSPILSSFVAGLDLSIVMDDDKCRRAAKFLRRCQGQGGASTAIVYAVYEHEQDKVVQTELPSSRLVLLLFTAGFGPFD